VEGIIAYKQLMQQDIDNKERIKRLYEAKKIDRLKQLLPKAIERIDQDTIIKYNAQSAIKNATVDNITINPDFFCDVFISVKHLAFEDDFRADGFDT
jgi:hypothetical protein